MPTVVSIEQGDKFESTETGTAIEVVKIWCAFNVHEERWETHVTWNLKYTANGDCQLSAKGREFIQILRDESFFRTNREEISSGVTTSPMSPSAPSLSKADVERQRWEENFRRNAAKWGLAPTDLSRKVTLNPRKPGHFTIVGAKPRNYKLPILVRGRRGGLYNISVENAKDGLV